MKFEIDLDKKTIKIEKNISFDKLIENLEMLLPNGKWKEFELLTNVTINWNSNPIIIDRYPIYPYKPLGGGDFWWNQHTITCNVSNQTQTLNSPKTLLNEDINKDFGSLKGVHCVDLRL